jgi:sporulation protein YlmC with PRC-barrel domain
MCASFTDDDEGKRVVNANGEEIGMVKNVSGGTAHIDPDPGMTDTIKSKLGWGDTDEETYPLDDDNVESITDDEIRLQRL